MSRRRSRGFVLRRWPYSESSLALHFLSVREGVVPLLAKGVYKPNSGAMGVLDTWALIEADYGGSEETEMLQLYRAVLIDRQSGLSRNPGRMAAAAVIAELAELAAPSGPSAEEAYSYLERNLRNLASGLPLAPACLRALCEGVALLGLAPSWEDPESAAAALPGRELTRDSRERLATLSRNPASIDDLSAREGADCLTILGELLAYHLERPPRGWSVLRERLRLDDRNP